MLYGLALLGASHLQAHHTASVRQLAGRALRLMASQPQLCQAARQNVHRWLGPKHLAVLDLDEMAHVTPIMCSMPSSSSGALNLCIHIIVITII